LNKLDFTYCRDSVDNFERAYSQNNDSDHLTSSDLDLASRLIKI